MEKLPSEQHTNNAIENIFKSFIALFQAETNLREANRIINKDNTIHIDITEDKNKNKSNK